MWNDALPRNGITNWKTYYAVQGTDTTTGWQTWMKPAGCAWVFMFMIASGGGGGRSNNGALTVAAGGGGSGGVSRLLIPAFVIPDILYLRPGIGGAGATTAGAGSNGIQSYVSMQPNTTVANLVLSQAGGSGATGAAASTGGTAGVAGITTPAILCLGLFTTIAGQTGGAGATTANAAGSAVAFGASGIITTSGAGGGNGTGAGGDITGAGLLPTISGGAGTTGASGNLGFRDGQAVSYGLRSAPLLFSGASGGGGHSTGTAGRGGDASYGGGGGGGGATSGAGTSGNGGNGGDGLILIGAF